MPPQTDYHLFPYPPVQAAPTPLAPKFIGVTVEDGERGYYAGPFCSEECACDNLLNRGKIIRTRKITREDLVKIHGYHEASQRCAKCLKLLG